MAAAAPRPKSPPASPDPCGRHRLQLAVDALHREIGFLEGEISSIEGVHAASRCCKEVDDFVVRNPDPFITIGLEKRSNDQSLHSKKFRAKSCLSYLSWMICCCGVCSPFHLKRPPAPSCSCAGQLKRLCCCSSSSGSGCCCRCGVVYESCCCGACCAPCPRCSCDCTCSCPRCSCACPKCSDACCVPRCCLCL